MIKRKLKSGVNWHGKLNRKGVKQTGVKQDVGIEMY
jgi:hypothetical protein